MVNRFEILMIYLFFLKDDDTSMISTQFKNYAQKNEWTYTVNVWCLNPAVVILKKIFF
jgi:hypothetical protein